MNAVQRAILSAIIEHPGDCFGVSIPIVKELISRVSLELLATISYETPWLAQLSASDNAGAEALFVQCGFCECFALAVDMDETGERCTMCVEAIVKADAES